MIQANRLLRIGRLAQTFCARRHISWDKLSNKKITRLESDIELDDAIVKSRLINRNPRNLEQASIEHKPTGFWLDKNPTSDWNVIVLEQSNGHLLAYLRTWSGKKLVTASTKEPQLTRYFRNPDTRQAAILLAKVLSRRCLQSGYLCAGIDGDLEGQAPKMRAFLDSLVAAGFALEEPKEIEPRSNTDV